MQYVKSKLKGQGFLLIEPGVIKKIKGYRQTKIRNKEAGGILIGAYRGDHVHITSLTVPGQLDKRTRTSFHRRSPHHQVSALKSWLNSKRINTWVGEWHTHPEDYPVPSIIDIESWSQDLPNRTMVLLIQGRCDYWLGFRKGGIITKLEGALL